MTKKTTLYIMIFLLSACTQANHLGNPVTLPIRGVQAGIDNAVYDNRRQKVKKYVSAHRAQINADVRKGGGPALLQAMQLARVHKSRHAKLTKELRGNPNLYLSKDIEPIVVALMVHGN